MDALSLDQFVVFSVVVDEGSFAGAARRLERAQSAITYAIQKLEDQSGSELFDRSAYRPALTEAGEALLPRVRRILADVDDYRFHARQLSMGLEDELKLAIHPYTPAKLLSEVLRNFRSAFPRVRIAASLATKSAAIELLEQANVDLALIFEMTPPADTLKRLPCASVDLVAVASPRHPLAQIPGSLGPEALRDHMQLIVRDALTPDEERQIRGFGMDSTELWRVVNFEIMHSLILDGVGWGVVPLEGVQGDVKAGRLATLSIAGWGLRKTALTAPLLVVHATNRPLGPAGRWLSQEFSDYGRR
jgi:DNA-binding transcriptional LysR family regulator